LQKYANSLDYASKQFFFCKNSAFSFFFQNNLRTFAAAFRESAPCDGELTNSIINLE
jgi:hypothetical protein